MATDGAVHDALMEILGGDDPQEEVSETTDEVTEEVTEEVEQEEVSEDAETIEEESLSLDEIAPYLGFESDRLDVNEEGELTLKVKVDGEESFAKLADIVKSYQLEGHLNKRNMEVAETQKALNQQKAELENKFTEKLQGLQDLAEVQSSQLLAEYNSVDWNELKEYDKAEYVAKREEFRERQEQIQKSILEVQKQRQAKEQEYMEAEFQKLPTTIPEWADRSTMQAEIKGISEWMTGAGFSQEEQAKVYDSRQFAVLRKAWLYDELSKTKPTVDNKVKKARKLVKGGVVKSRSQVNKANLDKLKKDVSTGKMSAAEYLLATGKV